MHMGNRENIMIRLPLDCIGAVYSGLRLTFSNPRRDLQDTQLSTCRTSTRLRNNFGMFTKRCIFHLSTWLHFQNWTTHFDKCYLNTEERIFTSQGMRGPVMSAGLSINYFLLTMRKLAFLLCHSYLPLHISIRDCLRLLTRRFCTENIRRDRKLDVQGRLFDVLLRLTRAQVVEGFLEIPSLVFSVGLPRRRLPNKSGR